jgi:hypothetical protein
MPDVLKGLQSAILSASRVAAAAWRRIADIALGLFGSMKLILALAALVAGFILFSWHHEIADEILYLMARDGQIVVGSPTVYTRQRLVNDRLSQTAWLQGQLDVTKPETNPVFHSIDEVRTQTVYAKTKVGLAIGADLEHPSESHSAPTSSAAPSSEDRPQVIPEVEPTTADIFRAKNTYREEVRSAMMETQLDDRHDIRGNTIYRLAFDAAVLAGTKKDSLAVIAVKISHDWTDPYFANDYAELYEEWLRYMQKVLDDSVNEVAMILINRSLDGDRRLQLTLPTVISRDVCWLLVNLQMIEVEKQPDFDETSRLNPCNSATSSKELKQANEFLQAYISLYLKQRAAAIEDAARANLRKAAGNSELALDKNVLTALESNCRVMAQSGRYAQNELQFPIADILPPQIATGTSKVQCPQYDSQWQGVIGGIILHEKLANLLAKKALKTPLSSVLQELTADCKDSREACGSRDPSPAELTCFAAHYVQASVNSFWDGSVPAWEWLNYFMATRVVGNEMQDCKVVVSNRPKHDLFERAGIRHDECERMFANESEGRLKCRLNAGRSEIFSYSVSPKNLTQRISTASDTRNAMETALNTRWDAQGKQLQTLVEALKKSSDAAHAIEFNPIVIGFGHSSDRSATETEFGWVIAPGLRIDGEREQADGEYSLAAVVSLPSWWRSVRIEIERCWVSRAQLHTIDDFKQCPDGLKTTEHIRVPGDIHGISEKLRFDVVQEPHLSNDASGDPLRLQIGRRANVILIGGRLWRSTEVTLGSQKADEIVVLPNMEGIIATFRCVYPQLAKQVHIRVWTSEGVTDGAYQAELVETGQPPEAAEGAAGTTQQADSARSPTRCSNQNPSPKSAPAPGNGGP